MTTQALSALGLFMRRPGLMHAPRQPDIAAAVRRAAAAEDLPPSIHAPQINAVDGAHKRRGARLAEQISPSSQSAVTTARLSSDGMNQNLLNDVMALMKAIKASNHLPVNIRQIKQHELQVELTLLVRAARRFCPPSDLTHLVLVALEAPFRETGIGALSQWNIFAAIVLDPKPFDFDVRLEELYLAFFGARAELYDVVVEDAVREMVNLSFPTSFWGKAFEAVHGTNWVGLADDLQDRIWHGMKSQWTIGRLLLNEPRVMAALRPRFNRASILQVFRILPWHKRDAQEKTIGLAGDQVNLIVPDASQWTLEVTRINMTLHRRENIFEYRRGNRRYEFHAPLKKGQPELLLEGNGLVILIDPSVAERLKADELPLLVHGAHDEVTIELRTRPENPLIADVLTPVATPQEFPPVTLGRMIMDLGNKNLRHIEALLKEERRQGLPMQVIETAFPLVMGPEELRPQAILWWMGKAAEDLYLGQFKKAERDAQGLLVLHFLDGRRLPWVSGEWFMFADPRPAQSGLKRSA